MTKFTGTPLNDTFSGTSGDDIFNLGQGGNDTASGGKGNDTFVFAAAFTAKDHINGGSGSDILILNGDYTGSHKIAFGAATMVGVETIQLAAGHSYALTTNDANVGANKKLVVDAHKLGTGNALHFNGSHEANGKFDLIGGKGDDVLTGGAKNDIFDLSHGGNDTANGGAGNDVFSLGTSFTAADRINGGLGTDTLAITGTHPAATLSVTLSGTNLSGIEMLKLSGSSFDVLDNDQTFGANNTGLTVDAHALTASQSLLFSGYDSVPFSVIGGQGDDNVTTVSFMLSTTQSGLPLGTPPGFSFDGGAGNDTFEVQATQYDDTGAYPGTTIAFSTASLHNIETLVLAPYIPGSGSTWDITEANGTVAAGKTLSIEAGSAALDSVSFDGSAETNGNFQFFGSGFGTVTFKGGAGNDLIQLGSATAWSGSSIDGGTGNDTLELNGDFFGASSLNVTAAMLSHIDTLKLDDGNSFWFNLDVGVLSSGQLTVDGSGLTGGAQIFADCGTASGGQLHLIGGDGVDDLLGGFASTNFMNGGGGGDVLSEGGGDTTFQYGAASDSASVNFDTVSGFDAGGDFFDLPGTTPVNTIDSAITTGTLNSAGFDSGLASAVGAIANGDAVVFTPDAGDYNGVTFLIVNVDGTDGYQAGTDFVIKLENPDLTSFGTASFI